MPGFALLPEIMSSVTRAFHIGKVHGGTTQDMNEFGRSSDAYGSPMIAFHACTGSFPQPAIAMQI